ncbi:MAG TPA: CoA pyrophosphatase [Vicinamibacteria bacterium]|nr:CoA pyrophosphatase [Vicinamibacteria bacterium]
MTGWDELGRALRGHAPVRVAGGMPRAAVALVLREGKEGVEILFIRRAEHEKDPWSGHMGFPGGRAEPDDPSPEATAVRETLEETGLDLARDGESLGALDEVKALARGRPVDLVIAPFVFRLSRTIDGTPSHEVVSLHWLPLSRLLAPETRSTLQYQYEENVLDLPCLRIEGLVIWGLTYRMFEDLRAVLVAARPDGPDPEGRSAA